MNTIQLLAHGIPGWFALRTMTDPSPGPEEVVVQVHACGINHLDLWLEEGRLPIPVTLPRTAGSEVAGTIIALGDDVDEWRTGDRVAIQSNLFCGACEYCLRGEESLCLNGKILGVECDGGFAEQVVVPWQSLVRLPDNVDYAASAALTLAGSTAMHMLADRAEVRAGDWVLVSAGAGGVGSAAIQIAKQFGAQVIATASTENRRACCLKLGADHAIDSSQENWPAQVRRLTQKRGVDLVVEHVGGKTLENCFRCLARGGTIVTCGATAGREPTLPLWPFFVKQQRLIGSYGRNRVDLIATLDWVASGKLKPVIDHVVDLAQVPEALNSLRARSVLGKILVVPR
jgi:2-desacetyl-2-hydroxyethyl bacteriochlorophyllide A dehydrogenase